MEKIYIDVKKFNKIVHDVSKLATETSKISKKLALKINKIREDLLASLSEDK